MSINTKPASTIVKVFSTSSEKELENQINEWIDKDERWIQEIVDINFDTHYSAGIGDSIYSALVTFTITAKN